jgi:hypothetical protein
MPTSRNRKWPDDSPTIRYRDSGTHAGSDGLWQLSLKPGLSVNIKRRLSVKSGGSVQREALGGKRRIRFSCGVCHILTPAEETAILGQPPAGGTRVYRTGEGWNCVFGAGPVQTAAGLKFHIIAQEELDCGSAANEKQAWVAFAQYGSRWEADSAAPVWSLSRKAGGALGVILRNGCVFGSGAAITNKALVVPGSQQAALAALNEVYSRAG